MFVARQREDLRCRSRRGKEPPTKIKYRPGIATVLGRAVVLDDFFNGLKTGTDQQRKDLAQDVGVTLDADDLKAMQEMDWDTAAAAAGSLRATLPERQGGAFAPDGDKDLAGW